MRRLTRVGESSVDHNGESETSGSEGRNWVDGHGWDKKVTEIRLSLVWRSGVELISVPK